MGERWEAPAKLNLSLEVGPRDESGYHPLRSLVQTIELLDVLDVEEAEDDRLVVEGAQLDPDDNLVWKAAEEAGRPRGRPRLDIRLTKRIPLSAGLGGGSSDAAATLAAIGRIVGLSSEEQREIAPRIGADVSLFLVGGTLWMEGYGERITSEPDLETFAVAIAVADVELSTPEVYRRWDELDGPKGPVSEGRRLPPPLRRYGELRNDLTPAAVDLVPELGDLVEDLSHEWEGPVLMSGSGPSLFGFFRDVGDARDALRRVPDGLRSLHAAAIRRIGVAPEE